MREYSPQCRFTTKGGVAPALCAAVFMAALAGDAEASVSNIDNLRDVEFGSAAGDADLAGTASLPSNSDNKTVAGGVFDLGGFVRRGRFRLKGPDDSSYNCTLPSQIQISSGGNTITFDNIVANKSLSGNLNSNGRKTIKIGGTLQIAAGQPAGSYSGNLTMDCGTANASISVTVTLGAAISISSTNSLDFGSLEPSGVAGTVTITPAGGRTLVNVIGWVGAFSAAGFSVTGEGSQAYAITLPSSTTLTGPSASMTVDTFTDDAGSPALSGGSDTFNVGATLHVGANQAAGAYSGTFAVTVSYN